MNQTCLCCGYKTLDEKSTFDICPICYWEDEPASWCNPTFVGGANSDVSLHQAQQNFIDFGACEKCMILVIREPTVEDILDEKWKTFLENYEFLR